MDTREGSGMAEQQRTAKRRPGTSTAAKATLARLLEARDNIDADAVGRRKREEEALTAFAMADVAAQAITDENDRQLAELERQAAAVRDKTRERLVAVDQDKAAALLTLTNLGRSADELAAMTGIGVKKVRAMIREARPSTAGPVATPAAVDRAAAEEPAKAAASAADDDELASSEGEPRVDERPRATAKGEPPSP